MHANLLSPIACTITLLHQAISSVVLLSFVNVAVVVVKTTDELGMSCEFIVV